jgi:hypothetical protein
MSDDGLEKYREQWVGASGPLPDVRSMARRNALRDRLGTWTLIALYAFGAAANIWLVVFDNGDPIVAAFLCVWSMGIAASLLWIQRESRVRPTDGPKETLVFFERRVRVERIAAQIFRWAHVVSILFFSIYYRDLFGDDAAVKLVARVSMGAILLAMLVITFMAPRWAERRAVRQRQDVELWRRWMEEQQL